MSGTILRLLEHGFDTQRLDSRGELFRLMADYSDDFFRVERKAGAHDMVHKRTASRTMENFCQAGFEAGAPSGGKDEDGDIFIRHGESIVHWAESFDNAAGRGGA